MTAPRSLRSLWLQRACWAFIGVFVLGNLIFDVRDRGGWVRWFIALPITALSVATLVAYLVSRLNDGWDLEARERRAVRGDRYSSSP